MSRAVTVAFLIAVIVAACGSEPGPPTPEPIHPAALVGSTWQLASMDGRAIPQTATVILRFGPADLGGDGPCNGYGGGYEYDPSTGVIRIEAVVSTKRACVDGQATAIETGYLRALQAASVVTLDAGDVLFLEGSAGWLAFVRSVQPAQSQTGPS